MSLKVEHWERVAEKLNPGYLWAYCLIYLSWGWTLSYALQQAEWEAGSEMLNVPTVHGHKEIFEYLYLEMHVEINEKQILKMQWHLMKMEFTLFSEG